MIIRLARYASGFRCRNCKLFPLAVAARRSSARVSPQRADRVDAREERRESFTAAAHPSFPRKREPRRGSASLPWVPAFAGMTALELYRLYDPGVTLRRIECRRRLDHGAQIARNDRGHDGFEKAGHHRLHASQRPEQTWLEVEFTGKSDAGSPASHSLGERGRSGAGDIVAEKTGSIVQLHVPVMEFQVLRSIQPTSPIFTIERIAAGIC